jgi:hypothetical protein
MMVIFGFSLRAVLKSPGLVSGFRDLAVVGQTVEVCRCHLRILSNRLQMSLVCFGVTEAREAISGDLQLSRRFERFTLSRSAAHEQF